MKTCAGDVFHFVNSLLKGRVGRTASTENATLCGDRACRVREMQARVRFVRRARNPLRRSCVSSARNAGESAICPVRAQPSAEIARVECAKCRRECDLARARATLCGDRACRAREMQARVRLARSARNPLRRPCVSSARNARKPLRRSCVSSARNAGESAIWPVPARKPLRRSCVSSARNAGESAIWPVPAQPSAEIVRVECAKRRRECDLSHARATLCGHCACRVREMQARLRFFPVPAQPSAEIVRVEYAKYRRELDWFCARTTLCGDRACRVREMQARVRSVRSAQLSAEIARVECAKCRRECDLGSRKMSSGDLLVQL